MSNHDVVSDLEPQLLWRHFATLSDIPRPSKREQGVRDWLAQYAKERDFAIERDDYGNLVIRVPGRPGFEDRPAVAIQGHIDMVCEKEPDVDHDFERDPIRLRRDGDRILATGTTLGADNGIGVCAGLAAAEADIPRGPLELLITVEEEIGLLGAAALDPRLLTAKTMLNLDSEEDGTIYVGCAGGMDVVLKGAVAREHPPAGHVYLALDARGLRGGHSGLDIGLGLGNAVQLVARLLRAAAHEADLRLVSLAGGTRRNAIAREATGVIAVPADRERAVRRALDAQIDAFTRELGGIEPNLEATIARAEPPVEVWCASDSTRTIRLLAALPHGVQAMSRDLPGLVETSCNLAMVTEEPTTLTIGCNCRSSRDTAREAAGERIAATGELAGFTAEIRGAYPGWQPELSSTVLGVLRESYREMTGADPEVTAIHAGLECGVIGRRVPGVEMISFGPDIQGAHSPTESVSIPSVERFWRVLVDVLRRLSAR